MAQLLAPSSSTIIKSLVSDVIMPLVSMMTGGVDFSNMFAVISNPIQGANYATLQAAQEAGAVTINYGLFINAIVTFTIVAFSLFMVIKGMNAAQTAMQKQEAEEQADAEPSDEVKLLSEIRDTLKK